MVDRAGGCGRGAGVIIADRIIGLAVGAATGGTGVAMGFGCGCSVWAVEGGGVAAGLVLMAISSSFTLSTVFKGGGVAWAVSGLSVFSSDLGGGVAGGAGVAGAAYLSDFSASGAGCSATSSLEGALGSGGGGVSEVVWGSAGKGSEDLPNNAFWVLNAGFGKSRPC